jgi:serine/threonine-protein kinase
MSGVDPTEPPSEAEVAATLADGVAGRARDSRASLMIGRFEVRNKLGEGGMGIVYEAYDAQLDRRVAIKLVRVGDVGTQARARLLREAQAMAKVSHPNVVPIYEVGEHGDQVFVAMELVAGQPLSQWQRRERRSWQDTLAIYIAAGRGLAAAHACGIIHRDFKPDNVLVGSDGRPRVLDFGLARSFAAPPDEASPSQRSVLNVELTMAGSMMGTPTYMSPEHFRGEGVGPASDQFGFAVAIYRGLFGDAPFAGDTIGELRTSVCAGALRPPRDDAEIPATVVAAIVRALSVDPRDRFASMDQLLEELEQPLRIDPTTDPTRGRRGRRVAAAALSIGALASLISTSTVSRLDHSPGWILVQSCIALAVLSVIGLVFRKSLVTSEHNRRVGLVILVTTCGFVTHRAVAYLLDSPTLDTLVGDAVMLGVITVLAGVLLERWMLGGGPIALVYVAVAIAVPSVAGPAFGALVLVYAAVAAYRWGEPARPWRKRRVE